MQQPFTIITRTQQQVQDTVIQAAKNKSWNPGLDDAANFYTQCPAGILASKFGDEIIGCASATIYDPNFAFFGCYIISEPFRAQGYGLQLIQHRMAYIGERNIGLNGVLSMCDKNASIGFRTTHLNQRIQGQVSDTYPIEPNIVNIDYKCIPTIFKYDQVYFPASRPAFISHRLHQSHGNALAILKMTQLN